jgi:hypothetical protein
LSSVTTLLHNLVSPLPLNNSAVPLSCRPFFIITSGRSGSTLLRAILQQEPTICIPPESHVLGQLSQRFQRYYRYVTWEYAVRLVVSEFESVPGLFAPPFSYWEMELSGFYRLAGQLPPEKRNLAHLIDLFYNYYRQCKKPAATRWGDKSVRNIHVLPAIARVFPQAQYIHIIRDGRDVVTSFRKHGIISDLTVACRHWTSGLAAADDFGSRLNTDHFLQLYYEALVADPETVMRQVCTFLSLDYTPQLLTFWQSTHELGDAQSTLHQNLKRQINTESAGNWRQQLSLEEQETVQSLLKEMLKQHNYPILEFHHHAQ